jgi:hypothetical protein
VHRRPELSLGSQCSHKLRNMAPTASLCNPSLRDKLIISPCNGNYYCNTRTN